MIKGLVITDFMAIAKLELELTAPLNFIAGHNEAGKSSIRDALLWGFTGQARGLKTHGDQAALIREGAKAAEVSIYLADGHAFTRRKTQKTAAAIMGAEANPRYLALWQTLLLTGCRRKEVVTLTWTDIDLPGRRIEITTTKNKRPRVVWITDDLKAVLEGLTPGVGRLFPWGLCHVSRQFRKLCARVGIKARLHDLRHSYGSYLAMAGVDLFTIGKLMGHRSIKSTEIYAHLSPEHLAHAQTKLANALNLRIVPQDR